MRVMFFDDGPWSSRTPTKTWLCHILPTFLLDGTMGFEIEIGWLFWSVVIRFSNKR